jgi:hypothetical protein
MRKTWIALAAAAMAVVALYAYRFGPGTGWQLSAQTEDWARFGQYVGGLFGVLAFIAVMVLLEIHRRQIDTLGMRATQDQLLLEARDLAAQIEALVARPIETVAITQRELTRAQMSSTVAGVLELVDVRPSPEAAEQATRMSPPAEAQGDIKGDIKGDTKGAYRKSIVGSTGALSHKLDLLAAVLSEFVSRGGDSIFLLFYRDRFGLTVKRLMALDVAINTGEWWLLSTEDSDSKRWRF